MEYPANCIRGIPNESFLNDGNGIATHLFFFNERDSRENEWAEQSINWEDDNNVRAFTLNQTKDNGELQFKAGIAILPRDEIDRIRQKPAYRDVLSYERQPLTDNPYHGNILLHRKVKTAIMKQIAATLALYAEYIPRTT